MINKNQIVLTVVGSTLLTMAMLLSSSLLFSWNVTASTRQQPAEATYLTVSALTFVPVSQTTIYSKNVTYQLLSLNYQTRSNNIFVAPLALPHGGRIVGLTVFGQDFDGQGEVRLRLKRCDNGQARCMVLAETTSTTTYNFGQFETTRLIAINEPVDNYLYSYILEAELTALLDSGLRSVRLELAQNGAILPPEAITTWSLAGSVYKLTLPGTDLVEMRICTDDLSHLKNPSHYPKLVVDGTSTALLSAECVTTWGRNFEIQRDLNAGPSSGTYQILR
jgi:hypothetical protein